MKLLAKIFGKKTIRNFESANFNEYELIGYELFGRFYETGRKPVYYMPSIYSLMR